MTQFVVTLENNADASFLRRVIENLKGVVRVSENKVRHLNKADEEAEEWIRKMKHLSGSISPDIIDMNDERTRYIMSK